LPIDAAAAPNHATRTFVASKLALPAVLAISLGILLTRVIAIGDRQPLDFNEGWNALHAALPRGVGGLYPDPAGLVANNYPPLSFLLVHALAGPDGDLIVTGRMLSLAGMVAVAGMVFAAIRRLAPRTPGAAWLGLTTFLAFNATLFRAYVGMNDPQWQGHALATAGLLLLLWQRPGRSLPRRRVAAAGLLAFAGGAVKHNLVAIPAAVTLWLLARDRRALAAWVGAGVGSVILAGWIDHALFGGRMLASMAGFSRSYSLPRMLGHGALGIAFAPLIALAWRLRRLGGADGRMQLLADGSMIAVVVAIVQGSGAGVDVNAWFEALILLSIAAPVGAAHVVRPLWRLAPTTVMTGLAAVLLPFGLAVSADELAGREERLAQAERMTAAISAIPGPVACQMQALCYWAGKSLALDFFMVGQKLAGKPDATLAEQLGSLRLGGVEMEGPPGPPDSLEARLVGNRAPAVIVSRRRLYVFAPVVSHQASAQVP